MSPLDPKTLKRLKQYMADRSPVVGEPGAIRALGIHPGSVWRALAGLSVRPGTAALIRVRLDELDAKGAA